MMSSCFLYRLSSQKRNFWMQLLFINQYYPCQLRNVCSYHVTYAFHSESTLYSCLNVKEVLPRNRRQSWSLSDCNGTRWVRLQLQSLKLQISFLFRARRSLTFRATIECEFTLKRVRDMIRTYSQMYRTNKYSQHSSIIWPVWLNGWVFVYELNRDGFESHCRHLNFRYRDCFYQGAPWNSGNHRVWIYSGTCMWYDKKIKSNATYR